MKNFLLLLILPLLLSSSIKAANRYWISGGLGNWNDINNWSTTNGGTGGASVPSVTDKAIFNANGLGNCNIDAIVSIGGLTVNGYTGIIDLLGFPFTTSGSVSLTSGTINDTPGTSSLTISSSGTSTFSGTNFGAIVNATSARLYLSGSFFNASASFIKNGLGNDNSAGGNTFNGITSITCSGSGRLLLGNTTADIFNAQLTISSTGSNVLRLAQNGATTQFNDNVIINSTGSSLGIEFGQGSGSAALASGKIIIVGGSGFSVGSFEPRNFTQLGATPQSLLLTGTATLDLEAGCVWNGDVNFSAPRIQLEQTTFNGTATLTKTGATNDSGIGGNIFNSTATIVNNGSANFLFANANPDTFNNDLTLITGGTGRIYLSHTANGTNFNGNIYINYITNPNIYIGSNSGASTLANGKTISIIGAGASGTGNLYLEEFSQTGTTAQGISMNGTGILSIGPNSTFNGDLFTSSPGLYINQSTFNGVTYFDKTGVSGNTSYGGNTYNGITTIINSGSNYLRLAGTVGNTYNAQVTFSSTGTNRIEPARKGNSSYNDNIIINSTGTSTGIRFGQDGGISTLASTKTITVGGSGFSTGYLRFRNFNQTGVTAQSLTITGTSRMYLDSNNTWNGNINYSAPRMFLDGNTFNGTATITKTGAGNDNGVGDNTFNGVTELISTGTGYLGLANTGNDTFNENLIVNSTGGGIYFGTTGGTTTLVANKTITVGGIGFSAGQLRLRGFTQIGTTPQNLTLTGTGILYNFNANWGDDVTFIAPRNLTRGTIYNGTAYIEKTDATNDVSVGGNTFNSNVEFVNSGSGYLMMGNGTFDTYAANVTITNSGTYHTYFANSGVGHIISGDLTVNNTATGSDNYIYIANNATADLTVNGTTIINNNGTATNNRVYVGNNGSITFNGTVDLNNIGTGSSSEIYCNHTNGTVTYNENITLTSTNGSGIRFGESGGASTLANTKTVTVDAGGFNTGELRFRNFTQTGATAQSITLTGSALLRFREGNVFNADFTSTSPRLYIEGGTFNGTTQLTKNGNYNDDPRGGSIFNGVTTINNNSTRRLRMNNNASYSDVFNNDITFVRSGTGALDIARAGTSTFAGNIYINGASTISFGAGGGTAEFNGTSAQSINDAIGTSATPEFYNLNMNNSVNELTLDMPITVRTTLALNNGNIITTASNLLSMIDGSVVTSVSNNSYIAGPLEKIGDDAFTFPVGNGGFYAAISISAPTTNTHSFRAEYLNIQPHSVPYDSTLHDPSIHHISHVEYWNLDRIVGGSNVNVTLSWDSIRSGTVTSLSDLVVARWNGATWKDHGTNGSPTGNTISGSVTSNAPITSFSPFTLATITALNPLPIELINFEANINNSQIDLSWVTATEINNDFFTVERSIDGENWDKLTTTKGAGNSNQALEYYEIDYSPYLGVSYYRLKQTDFDGQFSYSNPVPVKFNKESALGKINLSPSPITSEETLKVEFKNIFKTNLLVVIRDVKGREFYSKVFTQISNNKTIGIPINTNIPSGMYFVIATSDNQIYSEKLIIK